MSELKKELKNKRKSRAGHKSYLTQVLKDVDGCLGGYTEERKKSHCSVERNPPRTTRKANEFEQTNFGTDGGR